MLYLPENLKKYRILKNLTQEDIAEYLGITPQSVSEEKLRATMTDEQKELFEKYVDCVREHQTITDCLIFQNSDFHNSRTVKITM